jgi:hypothetical protein
MYLFDFYQETVFSLLGHLNYDANICLFYVITDEAVFERVNLF